MNREEFARQLLSDRIAAAEQDWQTNCLKNKISLNDAEAKKKWLAGALEHFVQELAMNDELSPVYNYIIPCSSLIMWAAKHRVDLPPWLTEPGSKSKKRLN